MGWLCSAPAEGRWSQHSSGLNRRRVPHPAHIMRNYTNHGFPPNLEGATACLLVMKWCKGEPKLSPTVVSMVRDHVGGNGSGDGHCRRLLPRDSFPQSADTPADGPQADYADNHEGLRDNGPPRIRFRLHQDYHRNQQIPEANHDA